MTGRVAFAVPGDLDTPTGGYAYDRRVIEELELLGWEVTHVRLGASFPAPSAEDMSHAGTVLHSLSPDTAVIIDGLALGALDPAFVADMAAPVVALIHHPLAHEGGLEASRRNHAHGSSSETTSSSAMAV